MPFLVKVFKKMMCLLHTLPFPFHEPEAEDPEDIGDGRPTRWKEPGSVNQRDTSQPEHQHWTVTSVRKGLFVTAAGTTLKNAVLVIGYLYVLIKSACKGTVTLIPVSLVKKPVLEFPKLPKNCSLLFVSHLSFPAHYFLPRLVFLAVPQPTRHVPT